MTDLTPQSLLLGQADAADFLAGLSALSVDAVITDPPYGFDQMSEDWSGTDTRRVTAAQTVSNLTSGMAFKPDQARKLAEWFAPYAAEFARVLKPGAFAVVFSAPRLAHGFASALDQVGLCIREVQVWEHGEGQFKAGNLNRYGVNSDLRVPMPRPLHESIIVAQKLPPGNGVVALHKDWGTALMPPRLLSGEVPSSILRVKKPGGEERSRAGNHPTLKPEELMAELCHLWCPEGGLVIDPFAGSGSTGVGAIRTGRSFLGCERSAFAFIANERIALEALTKGRTR